MGVRKNQKSLTTVEWNNLIDAIDKLHSRTQKRPRYRNFVAVHERAMSNMAWAVHGMQMGQGWIPGRNFLAWHRWYILQFEKRLQQIDASVNLPYWNAAADRSIPAPLTDAELPTSWDVDRDWSPEFLPTQQDVTDLGGVSGFTSFQTLIEGPVHAGVHVAVGGDDGAGDMGGGASPEDPLFWLHHANIDRLWSEWQVKNQAATPLNPAEKLRPFSMFGIAVKDVLDIAALGYSYS